MSSSIPLYTHAGFRDFHHEASQRLENNFDGRIINPIAHYKDEELTRDVEDFVKRHLLGLVPDQPVQDPKDIARISLFQAAAKVARNPQSSNTLAALGPEDRSVLEKEKKHPFKQPWKLYLTLMTLSFGALTQGWSQTGINGANIGWTTDLNLDKGNGARYDWLFGIVNAATYLAAGLIGCIFVDPINNALKLGRRGTISVAAVFSLIAPLGSAMSQTWVQLLVTRLLLGIGMGLKASTIPIFAAEISPTRIRGSVVMFWQLWDAFGIFLGYCANLIVLRSGIAWRLQAGSSFIPAVPLLALIYLCPESPRWYIKQQRLRSAFHSIYDFRGNELLAARDTYLLFKQIEVEEHYLAGYRIENRRYDPDNEKSMLPKSTTYFGRLQQLGSLGRIRRATVASVVVMLGQQLCGINIVSFYSSNFFLSVTAQDPTNPSFDDSRRALFFAFGTGLCNFLFTLPAIRTIDIIGRRKLLLYTFPNMAWLLLAIGFSYSASDDRRLPLVATFTLIFVAFYSLGGGPVPFTYSAEAFPLSHREIGMGTAVAVNLFFAGLLALLYPRMNTRLGSAATLGIFCAFNMVAWVLIFLFVPETCQCSLEDLDFRFGVLTKKHLKFQGQTVAWYLQPRRRRGEKPSLYFIDEEMMHPQVMGEIGSGGNLHPWLGNGFAGERGPSEDDVSSRGSVYSSHGGAGAAAAATAAAGGGGHPDDVSGSSLHGMSVAHTAEQHSKWYGELESPNGLRV